LRIELLYVPGCPHHPAAAAELRKVLLSEGITAQIREIVVADAATAQQLRFRGSPSIRINGLDIESPSSGPAASGLACRMYPNSAARGVPPIEMIRDAVRKAQQEDLL
jgi:hypothetical protein